ncbi:MAG: YkgJ family cysteine cluster protein [Asgard group archaeon]|nr:YkgJ family cysteine cluster protein [Asgard group archaeon]
MKTIKLGGQCSNFTCAKCCIDTEMILSQVDIQRLMERGYEQDSFCYQDDDGFFRLRNSNGQCVFLKENRCTIYDIRPQGCRFYPLIYDLDKKAVLVDQDCPLAKTIDSKVIKRFETEIKEYIQLLITEQQSK